MYCKNFVNATVYPQPAQQQKKEKKNPQHIKGLEEWNKQALEPLSSNSSTRKK
jgi:hypothetical protein